MHTIRHEKFNLDFEDTKLKSIPGFTDGKEYAILNEVVSPNTNVCLPPLYKVVDDNGHSRHVSSAYFTPKQRLCYDDEYISQNQIRFDTHCRNQQIKILDEIKTKTETIDGLSYSDLVDDERIEPSIKLKRETDFSYGKVTTLEEKVKENKKERQDDVYELRVLAGMISENSRQLNKDSFEVMEETILSLEQNIQSLQKLKERLNLELEVLKRMTVLN